MSDAQGDAVSYLVNPAHTGSQAIGLSNDPSRRWDLSLGGQVSYPLIAGGRIFVTVADSTGSRLLAIDGSSGRIAWGPIELVGSNSFSAAAYDNGRVFTANMDGQLRSFDAATGKPIWTAQVGADTNSGWINAPPTAVGGSIYVVKGHLYAINESDGSQRWRSDPEVPGSAPTVGDGAVYTSNGCGTAAAFDIGTGSQKWGDSSCNNGSIPHTTVLYGNGLYVPGPYSGAIADAANGAGLAPYTYESFYPPAFSQHQGFFTRKSTDPNTVVGGIGSSLHLAAQAPLTGTTQWAWLGNGFDLKSNAVVAGDRVFVLSSNGELSGLSTSSGQVEWHDVASCCDSAVVSPEDNRPLPPTGIATGDGLLVAPVGDHLVAFG